MVFYLILIAFTVILRITAETIVICIMLENHVKWEKPEVEGGCQKNG